jgi:REP-associated tyrosine transposase
MPRGQSHGHVYRGHSVRSCCHARLRTVPRLRRSDLPEYGTFHITGRGVDRCLIYRDVHDYRRFSTLFQRLVRESELRVSVYCLMPNHYHAVIEGPMPAISRVMHRLNGIYARSFNERHDRCGHLFQERFFSRLVRDDEYLGNVCEYVLHNPVRAGLCADAKDWPWVGGLIAQLERP